MFPEIAAFVKGGWVRRIVARTRRRAVETAGHAHKARLHWPFRAAQAGCVWGARTCTRRVERDQPALRNNTSRPADAPATPCFSTASLPGASASRAESVDNLWSRTAGLRSRTAGLQCRDDRRWSSAAGLRSRTASLQCRDDRRWSSAAGLRSRTASLRPSAAGLRCGTNDAGQTTEWLAFVFYLPSFVPSGLRGHPARASRS
jgi:hypothetical protein